jgi:hypothetical protein
MYMSYSGPEDWILNMDPGSLKALAAKGIQPITAIDPPDTTNPLPMQIFGGQPWGSTGIVQLDHCDDHCDAAHLDESALDGEPIQVTMTATICPANGGCAVCTTPGACPVVTGVAPVLLVPDLTLTDANGISQIQYTVQAGQPNLFLLNLEPVDALSLFITSGDRIWEVRINYGQVGFTPVLITKNPDPLGSVKFNPPLSHPSSITVQPDGCDTTPEAGFGVTVFPRNHPELQFPLSLNVEGDNSAGFFIAHPLDCSSVQATPATLTPDGNLDTVVVSGNVQSACKKATVSASVLEVFADEPISAGNTADAFFLSGSTVQLRAVTDPGSDGRVYHLWTAFSDTLGGGCNVTNTVCVPTTTGGTCKDEGPRVDVTGNGNTYFP